MLSNFFLLLPTGAYRKGCPCMVNGTRNDPSKSVGVVQPHPTNLPRHNEGPSLPEALNDGAKSHKPASHMADIHRPIAGSSIFKEVFLFGETDGDGAITPAQISSMPFRMVSTAVCALKKVSVCKAAPTCAIMIAQII